MASAEEASGAIVVAALATLRLLRGPKARAADARLAV